MSSPDRLEPAFYRHWIEDRVRFADLDPLGHCNGTVNLIGTGREGPQRSGAHERLCVSGRAGDLGPGLEGLGPGGSILGGREVITAEVEEIVDLIVSGEKALGLTG